MQGGRFGKSYHVDDELTGKVYDHQLMKRMMAFARPYWGIILICLVIVLLSNACFIVGPWLMGQAIDKGIIPKDKETLTTIAILYLGVTILRWFFSIISSYLLVYMGQKIMYDMRMAVFTHLQKMSLRFFDKNPVGRLVTRVTNDIVSLSDLFSQGLVTLFSDVIMIVGIAVVMFRLNARLTLIAFTVVLFLMPLTFFFQARLRNAYREIRKRLARINAYLAEHIAGIRVTQLFSREPKNLAEFEVINKDHFRSAYQSLIYFGLFLPSVSILSAVSIALVIYFGGAAVVQDIVTLGVLTMFLNYIMFFFEPIRDLADKYNIFQSAMASAERVFKILDTPEDVTDPDQPASLPTVRGEIKFENVWFAYEETGGQPNYVLKDVSFTIAPGESVAIVGITGSGKSTIINLLGRFYDIQKGRISIDGVDIRALTQKELRRMMSIVLQDVFLFSGNIIDNIRLGEKQITLEQVQEVARYVNAHPFIERLTEKYAAPVMERGMTLSSGQRQLLSFARALIFNPKILILDEATSSVDVETESYIQEAINRLISGKTSIIIAHRLSTIQHVNRIMVIHKGELKETGSHEELLKQQGLYYKLYQLQITNGNNSATTN